MCNVQCDFRSKRSTVDHLVRFETFCREAFIHNQHLVSVFFDLEKAYDTTWKYEIIIIIILFVVLGLLFFLVCFLMLLGLIVFFVGLPTLYFFDLFPV